MLEAPGHEFQYQPVPGFHGPENDFINGLFLQDIPMDRSFYPKHLFHYGNVAGIMERFINVVTDKIEKCGELGIPVFSGKFVVAVGETVQE